MKTKSKTFKIGEYVGGIIQVTVGEEKITVRTLDWNTRKQVETWSINRFEPMVLSAIDFYVCSELTSSYYTGKIVAWIKSAL